MQIPHARGGDGASEPDPRGRDAEYDMIVSGEMRDYGDALRAMSREYGALIDRAIVHASIIDRQLESLTCCILPILEQYLALDYQRPIETLLPVERRLREDAEMVLDMIRQMMRDAR